MPDADPKPYLYEIEYFGGTATGFTTVGATDQTDAIAQFEANYPDRTVSAATYRGPNPHA